MRFASGGPRQSPLRVTESRSGFMTGAGSGDRDSRAVTPPAPSPMMALGVAAAHAPQRIAAAQNAAATARRAPVGAAWSRTAPPGRGAQRTPRPRSA